MTANNLSVNSTKTENLFNNKYINIPFTQIMRDSNIISPGNSAKNLEIILQSDMSMDKHILPFVKSCFLWLLNFSLICPLPMKKLLL